MNSVKTIYQELGGTNQLRPYCSNIHKLGYMFGGYAP